MKNKNTEEYQKHESHFAKGVIWGVIIGGILGVLFAPDKGEETRKKLKKLTKEYEEKGKDAYSKVKVNVDKTKTDLEDFKEKAAPIIEDAKTKIAHIAKTIDKESTPIRDAFGDALESIESESKKVSRRYFKGTKKR